MPICRTYVLHLSRTSRYTCHSAHIVKKRVIHVPSPVAHFTSSLSANRLLFRIPLHLLNHARFVNTLGSNICYCFPAFKLLTLSSPVPTCVWLVHAPTVEVFTLQVSFYSMFSMTTHHLTYRKTYLSLLLPRRVASVVPPGLRITCQMRPALLQ